MVVITTIVLMERFFAQITQRFERVEHLVESKPVVIIEKGEVVQASLEESSFSEDSLMMKLREQGIENVGYVKKAYLEPSGNLSVFSYHTPPKLTKETQPKATNE